jgi:hypothetical protein
VHIYGTNQSIRGRHDHSSAQQIQDFAQAIGQTSCGVELPGSLIEWQRYIATETNRGDWPGGHGAFRTTHSPRLLVMQVSRVVVQYVNRG